MTTETLLKLRGATNDVLALLHRRRNQFKGPVNWADLSCLQAAWVVTDDGESYAEVTIEEASPESTDFQEAIRAALERRGWPDVRVVTEW